MMGVQAFLLAGTTEGEPEPITETIKPDGDDSNGDQTLEVSGGVNYYSLLNDASDSTYAYEEVSSECPTLDSGSCRVTMQNPSATPAPGQTVKSRVRILAAEALGQFGQDYIRVRIYEGTSLRVFDQASSVTKDIRTWYEFTWTEGEIASITDWNDLRMDLYCEGCVTGEGQDCMIQFIEAEIEFST